MTICCIIADRDGDGVWIGSDTLAVNCSVKENCGPKWVNCQRNESLVAAMGPGGWWIGVAGQIRALNLIQANAGMIAQRTSAEEVLDVVQTLVINDKWKPREEPLAPLSYAIELVITDGAKVFTAGGSFGMIECNPKNLAAIGSGTEAALGAAHALANHALKPEEVLRSALAAAIDINHNCGGPIWTAHIRKEK